MSIDEIRARWAEDRPFGELVRNARKAEGLSMRALGERVGLTVQYINDIEHGNRHAWGKREALAEALGFRYVDPSGQAREDIATLLAALDARDAEIRALRHVATEQIALAQYADTDFDEEVGAMFRAEPPARVAWCREHAADLLAERVAEAVAKGGAS